MKRILLALSLLIAYSQLSPAPIYSHDAHGAEKLGVVVDEILNDSKMWNGKLLTSYPDGQPKIKILRIKIPKGITLPWHYHPVINAAVILNGVLELKTVDGNTKTFSEGDALVEVVNIIHSGKAVGDEDVDLIVFYASENGLPTTVLEKP